MRRRAARLVGEGGGGGPWRAALLAPVAVSGERQERSGEREGASREERKENQKPQEGKAEAMYILDGPTP
jgi:hypothetical protein